MLSFHWGWCWHEGLPGRGGQTFPAELGQELGLGLGTPGSAEPPLAFGDAERGGVSQLSCLVLDECQLLCCISAVKLCTFGAAGVCDIHSCPCEK